MHYLFDDYTLDTARRELLHAAGVVPLEPKAYQVLVYLMEHRDRLVNKEELLDHIWPEIYVHDNAVARCVAALRQVLGDSPQRQQIIQTRRGQGYRFVASVVVQADVEPVQTSVSDASHPAPALPASPGAILPEPPTPVAAQVAEERKRVTVLCGTLALSATASRDVDDFHELVEAVTAMVQQVVQPYGGTLLEVSVDQIVVVFGAPQAQEDHAPRAVLAALGLQEQWRELLAAQDWGFTESLRFGLDTGFVVVRQSPATTPARPVALVGDVASQAMRLAWRPEAGVILLSAATAALVADVVRLEALPEEAWRVVDRRAETSITQHTPCVGRGGELATLHTCLAHAEAGHGQVVGIAGPAGMGKTRLLEEFRHSLADRTLRYLAGRCQSYGQATPYFPLRELVRQWCQATDADDATACTAKVQASLEALGLAPDTWAEPLLHLLGVSLSPDVEAGISPQAWRRRTFAVLHQLIEQSPQQPCVVVIENLHWIDATSEAYLSALVERLSGLRLLLLVTYRPGYQPPWQASSSATQLALAPLTPIESQQVVRAARRGVQLLLDTTRPRRGRSLPF